LLPVLNVFSTLSISLSILLSRVSTLYFLPPCQ